MSWTGRGFASDCGLGSAIAALGPSPLALGSNTGEAGHDIMSPETLSGGSAALGKTRPGFSSKATYSASFLTSLPRLEWWLCLPTLNLGAIHHLVLRPTEFLWMTHEAPSASAPAIICEATRGTKLTVPFSFHVERGRASPQGPLGGTCRFGYLTLQGLVKKDTANSHSQPMCPLMLEAQVSLPGRPSLAGPQGHTSGTPEARVLLCASCVHI